MNIFLLSDNIQKNCEYHVNSHVIKLPLEITQLLSVALWVNNMEAPMKPSHKNHPCALWVRNSRSNYEYALELAQALCKEYTYRYTKLHGVQKILRTIKVPPILDVGLTPFVQCMPIKYTQKDPIEAYRTYYVMDKLSQKGWRWEYKDRSKPSWAYEEKYKI